MKRGAVDPCRQNNISQTVEHGYLDTLLALLVLQCSHEEGKLTDIVDSEDGTPGRHLHEGIGIAPVRQGPVDRPQSPVLAAEVESVLAWGPTAMSMV